MHLTYIEKKRWILHRFIKVCLPFCSNDEYLHEIIARICEGETTSNIVKRTYVKRKTVTRIREAIRADNPYAEKFRLFFAVDIRRV